MSGLWQLGTQYPQWQMPQHGLSHSGYFQFGGVNPAQQMQAPPMGGNYLSQIAQGPTMAGPSLPQLQAPGLGGTAQPSQLGQMFRQPAFDHRRMSQMWRMR